MKCIICEQPNPEKGWAALYIRLSEDKAIIDDEGNRVLAGENVNDQKDKLSAMAHKDGFCISVIYNDNDKVASDPVNKPRPEFKRMLADAPKAIFERIYIRHMDRLYRTPDDLGDLAKAFQPSTITVHQEWGGHPLDLTTPMGYLIAGIMAAVAKYETDHKRMRQVAMNEVRMLKGEMYSGVHPYGWNKDNKTLNEPEASVIRECTANILRGRSVRSEYKRLNDAGIPSPRGGKWDGAALRQVLSRTANAGIVTYKGKMVAVEAQWTPIVSRADYYDLMRKFDSNSHDWTKEAKYLLTGLVICGECDSQCYVTYTQQTKKGKTYRYEFYQCNGEGKCASVSKKALEGFVKQEFLNKGTVMDITETQFSRGVDVEAIENRRIEIAAQLAVKGADRARLLDELDALDESQDKVILIPTPVVGEITTQYLWDLIEMPDGTIFANLGRDILSDHIESVVIRRGGKGRIPVEQKATVNFKEFDLDAALTKNYGA